MSCVLEPRAYTCTAGRLGIFRRIKNSLWNGKPTVQCCFVDPFEKTIERIELDLVTTAIWTAGSDSISNLNAYLTPADERATIFTRETAHMLGAVMRPRYLNVSKPTDAFKRYGEQRIVGLMVAGSERIDCLPGFSIDGSVVRGRAVLFKGMSVRDGKNLRPFIDFDLRPEDIDVTWVPRDPGPLQCVRCQEKATKKCAGCLAARYCTIKCHEEDWEHHKAACRASGLTRLT